MEVKKTVAVNKKIYLKKYYINNKEKTIAKTKQWRLDNPKRWKETTRARERSMKFRCKPNFIWHTMKKNSKVKNRSFPLLQADFLKWYSEQEKICFYCGVTEETHKNLIGKRLEIDRIINDLPYQIDNIVLCCRYCNSVKGSILNMEEMIFIGNNVIKQKWKIKQ